MARTSSTSNPTGLKEIDRRHVTLAVTRKGPDRFLTVARLELAEYSLPPDLELLCIARAGNSSQRCKLGTLGAWDKSAQLLKGLDAQAPVRFRLLVHSTDSPKLVATCENIRPRSDDQGESLLPMVPADLGEELWQFECLSDGPVLLFNQAVFPTAAVASAYPAFRALVMPEALRQVCRILAAEPDRFDDDNDPLSAWGPWIDQLGTGRVDRGDDERDRSEWVESVVKAFAETNRFASQLRREMTEVEHD